MEERIYKMKLDKFDSCLVNLLFFIGKNIKKRFSMEKNNKKIKENVLQIRQVYDIIQVKEKYNIKIQINIQLKQ